MCRDALLRNHFPKEDLPKTIEVLNTFFYKGVDAQNDSQVLKAWKAYCTRERIMERKREKDDEELEQSKEKSDEREEQGVRLTGHKTRRARNDDDVAHSKASHRRSREKQTVELIYFPERGEAELIRLLLVEAGIQYVSFCCSSSAGTLLTDFDRKIGSSIQRKSLKNL